MSDLELPTCRISPERAAKVCWRLGAVEDEHYKHYIKAGAREGSLADIFNKNFWKVYKDDPWKEGYPYDSPFYKQDLKDFEEWFYYKLKVRAYLVVTSLVSYTKDFHDAFLKDGVNADNKRLVRLMRLLKKVERFNTESAHIVLGNTTDGKFNPRTGEPAPVIDNKAVKEETIQLRKELEIPEDMAIGDYAAGVDFWYLPLITHVEHEKRYEVISESNEEKALKTLYNICVELHEKYEECVKVLKSKLNSPDKVDWGSLRVMVEHVASNIYPDDSLKNSNLQKLATSIFEDDYGKPSGYYFKSAAICLGILSIILIPGGATLATLALTLDVLGAVCTIAGATLASLAEADSDKLNRGKVLNKALHLAPKSDDPTLDVALAIFTLGVGASIGTINKLKGLSKAEQASELGKKLENTADSLNGAKLDDGAKAADEAGDLAKARAKANNPSDSNVQIDDPNLAKQVTRSEPDEAARALDRGTGGKGLPKNPFAIELKENDAIANVYEALKKGLSSLETSGTFTQKMMKGKKLEDFYKKVDAAIDASMNGLGKLETEVSYMIAESAKQFVRKKVGTQADALTALNKFKSENVTGLLDDFTKFIKPKRGLSLGELLEPLALRNFSIFPEKFAGFDGYIKNAASTILAQVKYTLKYKGGIAKGDLRELLNTSMGQFTEKLVESRTAKNIKSTSTYQNMTADVQKLLGVRLPPNPVDMDNVKLICAVIVEKRPANADELIEAFSQMRHHQFSKIEPVLMIIEERQAVEFLGTMISDLNLQSKVVVRAL